MPLRIAIPLPGPIVWTPRRRRRGPIISPAQRETLLRGAAAANERLGEQAERLDQFTASVERRNAAHRGRHDARMNELAAIRQLPPLARFRAAMRFPTRGRR